MAAPRQTIWPLPPHTRAKHEILRRYLHAWLAILAHSGFPEFIYFDGFAGPGQYVGGEDGSPIIALKAAIAQQAKIKSTVYFRFVEMQKDRAEYLQELVNAMEKPPRYNVKVIPGEFESAFESFLNAWNSKRSKMAPTFAFIDPFGWKVPFRLVNKLMKNSNCEVLVTFMYEEINRFIGHPDQESNFDILFGCEHWRDGIALTKPEARNRFLHDLYVRQLRESAHVRFVRSFEMRNENDVTDYFLFYGTNNSTGLKKMKEAMWKVDESGEFRFSDATDTNQLTMFNAPPSSGVREMLLRNFSGRETTVGDVERFIVEETAFRETHYKGVLAELEKAVPQRIVVLDPTGKRTRGFASKDLILKFL